MTEQKGNVEINTEANQTVAITEDEHAPVSSDSPRDDRRGQLESCYPPVSPESHRLDSTQQEESTIEKLAEKIETRRENRIPVPFAVRKLFLETCRDVAKGEGYVNKMSVSALHKLRDDYKAKVDAKGGSTTEATQATRKFFGYWNYNETMLQLLDAAYVSTEEVHGSWFFFRDFNYYNMVIAPRARLFSNPVAAALAYLFLFYFGSAVLFCAIMKDDVVCPNRGTYEGWLTSVYFASVTMSTVGYGDVTLAGGPRWRTFIGLSYMIVAVGVAYTVVSVAAEAALNAVQIGEGGTILFRQASKYVKVDDPDMPLHKRVRRIVALRVFELVIWFLLLNLVGVFVARYFVRNTDIENQQWDWMTTLYWAVQTTTTIGYGDLDMPFELRWFQIFFTTFGTAFVGAVFGAFAGLRDEVSDMRRFYAWQRREISETLIEEMQGSDADEKVDQFEFMVGSLLMLNKISRSDVEQIMDKYREMAGDKGYIIAEDAAKDGERKAKRDDTQSSSKEFEDMHFDVAADAAF